MSPRRVAAIARRILEGFRRDRRTVALVFGVPIVILSLFWYLMRGGGAHPGVGVVNLDSGPLGQQVTQRLLGFGAVALLQALIVLVYALYVIRIQNAGSVWLLFVFDALLAIGAVNLGIFFSTFARNEFQAVQFIPLVIVPQVLLSGIVFPVNTEPGLLQPVSNILPLTYAVYGMRDVMLKGAGLASPGVVLDLGVGALFAAVAIALGALTLRRRAA